MNPLAQMLQNPQVMQRIMQMMQQQQNPQAAQQNPQAQAMQQALRAMQQRQGQGQMRQPAQPMMGQRMPYNPQPVNLSATGGFNTPGFIGGAQDQAKQRWMQQVGGLQAGRDAQAAAKPVTPAQNSGVMGDPNLWANLYGG